MRNPKFLGVYSRKNVKGRKGRIPSWFAWSLADGSYAVQPLDQAYTVQGSAESVSAAEFESLFKLEPSILAAPVITPDFSWLGPRANELEDAKFAALERARKARQLEAGLRENFDKALRALSRPRDKKAALASIERIAETRQGIVKEHKHMFRDFGVALRKKTLIELALTCAARAVDLSPDDDHARFNLARLLGMAGRFDDAYEQLAIAQKLDPAEKVYSRLRKYLDSKRKQVRSEQDS